MTRFWLDAKKNLSTGLEVGKYMAMTRILNSGCNAELILFSHVPQEPFTWGDT